MVVLMDDTRVVNTVFTFTKSLILAVITGLYILSNGSLALNSTNLRFVI